MSENFLLLPVIIYSCIRFDLKLYELLSQSATSNGGAVHTSAYVRLDQWVKFGVRHWAAVYDVDQDKHVYLGKSNVHVTYYFLFNIFQVLSFTGPHVFLLVMRHQLKRNYWG